MAAALEERGFDSLFLVEHSHIPVSRQTPYPGVEWVTFYLPTMPEDENLAELDRLAVLVRRYTR